MKLVMRKGKRPEHTRGIGVRLTAAFLAVAFLTLASTVIGLLGFWQASRAARVLVEDAEMIHAVQDIRVAFGPLLGPASDYILSRDADAPEHYDALLADISARIAAYEDVHRTHHHTAEHSRPAERLISATKDDVAELFLLGETLFTSDDDQEALAVFDQIEAHQLETNSRLVALLVNAEEDIQSARSVHAAVQRNAYIGLSVSALLAFGLAVVLALVFTRSLSGPLAQLTDSANRITAGDLSTAVTVRGNGEIGQLSEDFERMRRALIRERGQLRMLAVLEERDRIGREIHDGLAQVLGYVNTKAQAVSEYLKIGDTGDAERQLQELIHAAQEAYIDAREVIVGLRQNEVRQRGLAELAEEYVQRFQRQSGVTTELTVAPSWDDKALPAAVKVQTLRIIQEALTNARKHAKASRVNVILEKFDNTGLISVQDDGCGFMLSRLLRPDFSRYGLRTMRERAQAVGGKLRIESAPGKGTSIVATLPLTEEEAAAAIPKGLLKAKAAE